MNNQIIDDQAKNDFNKARMSETFTRIINILNPAKQELFSLYDIKTLIRTKSERYLGMQAVPIEKIVGSEGRYKDFNKTFLPKKERIRYRWENVDKAHMRDVILPPIKLYKLGEVYFVRDGNHRVSVAKSRSAKAIDAEVVELESEIELTSEMTKDQILAKVINYEKERFFKQTGLKHIIDPDLLVFSTPGRYDEIALHINVHKYYMNLDHTQEISIEEAAESWYKMMFLPVCRTIWNEGILSRFPGRTAADMYCWVIRHWSELKNKYGEDYPITEAAKDYSRRFGMGLIEKIQLWIRRLFHR